MSTFGHPAVTRTASATREASRGRPITSARGLPPGSSAVTLFAGEAPHGHLGPLEPHGKSLAARSLVDGGLWNSKHFPLYSHTMLVVGPEHARTFADDGWSRDDLARYLHETIRVPYRTLLPTRRTARGRTCASERPPNTKKPWSVNFQVSKSFTSWWPANRGTVLDGHSGVLGTKNGSPPLDATDRVE